MAIQNTLEYSTTLQTALDQKIVQNMLTGWMDSNAGQVKYSGGNEVKIPTLATDGLGDYDRNADAGYSRGKVDLKFKTHEMTQDRGRKFLLDAMDVDETNFIATSASVMGEFQRTHVVPEVDAYRLSKLAEVAISVNQVEYGYTPNSIDIISKIKKGIKTLRENGFNGELICHLTYDAMLEIQENTFNKLVSSTFKAGGIDTAVPMIDRVPLIETPQNRMYSKIQLLDGKTSGQEQGGYKKADDGKDVNFIIVAKNAPVAITKQDKIRIFDPNTYQDANSWSMDYRRYHDIWVLENRKLGVYANIKDAQMRSKK